MKRLLLYLMAMMAFFGGCHYAPAANVIFPWNDIVGNLVTNKTMSIIPLPVGAAHTNSFGLVVTDTIYTNTGTGTVIVTNLSPGAHQAIVQWQNRQTSIQFTVPDTNATIDVRTILSTAIPNANTANALTIAASDARYIHVSNTSPVSLTNAANAFTGAFTGSGAGLTNLPATSTATNFSGSLSGNVTGTQGATVVSSVGSAPLPAANITGQVPVAGGGTGTGTLRSIGDNISAIKQMSPADGSGSGAFQNMSNAVSIMQGQWGQSYSGTQDPYVWFSTGVGTGTNVWKGRPYFPGGFGEIGDMTRNPTVSSSLVGMSINFNGSPLLSRRTNAYPNGPLGAQGDSILYVRNMNPFGSGSTVGTPMYTTNHFSPITGSANTPVLTNLDGVVIYEADPFGLEIVSIPDSDPQGELNQAPGFYLITGITPYNFGISVNTAILGETNSGQRSVFMSDNRYIGNASTNGDWNVGFPLQVPYCYVPTNALWKWALRVGEISGNVDILYGTTTVNKLIQTNETGAGGTFGGNYENAGALNANGTTNVPAASFNVRSANGGMIFLASYISDHNWGIGVKSGLYMGEVVTSGRFHKWYMSSAGSLADDINTQTFTEEAGIDNNKFLYSLFGINSPVYKNNDGAGSNAAGSKTVLSGGNSTGTGAAGAVEIKTAFSGTTGSLTNVPVPRIHVSAHQVALTHATATTIANVTVASGKSFGLVVRATTTANGSGDIQNLNVSYSISAVNKAGTVTVGSATFAGGSTAAASSGTLTSPITAVANGNSVDIKVNATSSLGSPTYACGFIIEVVYTDDTTLAITDQ